MTDPAIQSGIAARIRAVRAEKGMTQAAVARAADMHLVNFQRIEAGTQRLYVTTLVAIAEAMGVTMLDLLPPAMVKRLRLPSA